MALLLSVLEQGMIYAIMALGVYITYSILDFPDLSVDSTFPLGAAVTASMIIKGINPFLAILVSFILGMLAGVITGFIHVKLKIRDLLSGIIVMTALYSVNLHIAGRANLPIYNLTTIFDNDLVEKLFVGDMKVFSNIIIIFIIIVIAKILLDVYLSSKSGYLLQAVGDNETIVTSLGIDKGKIKILGLALANGLVAVSGSIYAQQQRYFDINMGTGTIVIGLASVIIGMTLFRRMTLFKVTSSVVIGAIIYKACVAIAIKAGLPSIDLKIITSLLFLIILVAGRNRKRKANKNARA